MTAATVAAPAPKSRQRAFVVRWKDCPRWDIKTAKATLFRLAHPDFRPLGDFAEEATEIVRPMDKPDHDWPVYGVNNTSGVFLNQRQKGAVFNAPYKRIRKDWFFHNPTRANVGSLGRVPDVRDDAITSPEYQVWRLRDGLLPAFVEILIKTRFFIDLIDCHRVGAVKERLFVGNLLEIPVPDVPLSVQRGIVAAWERARGEVADTRRRIAELEDKIEADFLADLGLTKPKRGKLPKVFGVRWKDVERWGVRPNQVFATAIDVHGGKYSAASGQEFLQDITHGCSASPSPKPTSLEVLKISAVTRGALELEERKFMHDRAEYRRQFDMRSGDVLLCRTNGTLGLVGMAALVERDIEDMIFPDKVIRLRPKANILPAYLWKALHMPFARAQIEAAARTAVGNFAIGTDDLWKLELPLPPLPVQRELVAKVTAKRRKIAALKVEAQQKTEQAKAEVEAMILGERGAAP